jgi:hypothetical protein
MKHGKEEVHRLPSEDSIDDALDASFPASDPPFWTLGLSTDAAANSATARVAPTRRARWRRLPSLRSRPSLLVSVLVASIGVALMSACALALTTRTR